MADGQRGWAVGVEGTILTTRDGGASWTGQASGTDSHLRAIAMMADGQRGWAVGDRGTILTTRDGGASWTGQASGTRSHLFAVAMMADGQRGWAVGGGGTILTTRDGGASWTGQASGTDYHLRAIAMMADGQRGWVVGGGGTILRLVGFAGTPTLAVGARAGSSDLVLTLQLPAEQREPVRSVRLEARRSGSKMMWTPIGAALPPTSDRKGWQLAWNPRSIGFDPGTVIEYQAVIDIGAAEPLVVACGSHAFEPWWHSLWTAHRDTALAIGAPFLVLAAWAGWLCWLLVIAPIRLARFGGAPAEIAAPSGNWAFAWGIAKAVWEGVTLPWICRHPRVRRAWIAELRAGRAKLADLGKHSRDAFLRSPDVLDAWVETQVGRARASLNSLELFSHRSIHLPLPLRMGGAEGELLEKPNPEKLRALFQRERGIVAVVGPGGAGKSSLACAMVRWAMSDDPAERLATHRMLPVFVLRDTRNLAETVQQELRAMLVQEDLPKDLLQNLMRTKRVLVVIDALSERRRETQEHVREAFRTQDGLNAVVITSRVTPELDAVDRTVLLPLLLDHTGIVPFVSGYVSQLEGTGGLRDGELQLELAGRLLKVVRNGGRGGAVTPLLVRMFVDVAQQHLAEGRSLNDLPDAVPSLFAAYPRNLFSGTAVSPEGVAWDSFQAGARRLAKVSLGTRLVPRDFEQDDALKALEEAPAVANAAGVLGLLISAGVVERRVAGGQEALRFSLDPAAEYFAAIESVRGLRGAAQPAVEDLIRGFGSTRGYPEACAGYLAAFAITYRSSQAVLDLPDVAFPWERPMALAA